MSWSALETIPSLSGKTREIRVLFADVANTALLKGRTTDEAIFQGLAAVKSKEKQSIVKQLRPSIPSHLKAILSVRDNPPELQIEKSTEGSQTSVDAIKSIQFDASGKLIMKFDNGKTLTSNVAPITVSEHSVIVVGDGSGTGGGTTPVDEGLDGGSATSVFKPSEVMDGGGAV